MSGSPTATVGTTRSARFKRAMQGLMIRDKRGRIVPMRFRPSQDILWAHVAPRLDRGDKLWFITLKGRQVYACLDPKTRILTDDLRWVPLEQIEPGQGLVTAEEERRDGRGNHRRLRHGRAVATHEVFEPAFRLVFDNGETLVATGDHRFLAYKGRVTSWRQVSTLRVGDAIRFAIPAWGPGDYEDAWFGGLLDGEGNMDLTGRGTAFGLSQAAGTVLDRAAQYLKSRGYDVSTYWQTLDRGQPICRLLVTRTADAFRLMGQTRPCRFLSRTRVWWDGQHVPTPRSGGWAKLVAIIPLGAQRMLDLQTTTGTFIAEGFVSHNSTFFQALTFIRTLEQAGTHSLVIAQDLDTTHNLFEMAKRFYDYLPLPKIRPPKVHALDFPFPGGASRYRVISAGVAAKGRGTTQTCVHCSEVAFWPHPEVLTGLSQAMPDLPDTLWVLESTANGLAGQGKMFYDEWKRAERGESDLAPIFIPWFTIPEYRRAPAVPMDDWDEEERLLVSLHGIDGEQIAWRRATILTRTQGSTDLFHQEYPSSPDEAFIATGAPAFDRLVLMQQRANIAAPVARMTLEGDTLVEREKGEVYLWERPQTGHEYAIGADTAEARANETGHYLGDYAAAQIIDCESLEQVASIHGHIQPYDFANLLNTVGRWYGNAHLNIEVYPQGHAVQDVLIRHLMYPNLHRWRGKPDRVRNKPATMYGWETNVWSRPLLIEAGQRAINRNLVTLHESGLIDELTHFAKTDDGRYEAQVGHDDRVMALLLALRSREENYLPRRPGAPVVSDENVRGVRIVEARDVTGDAARRISRILKERVADGLKSWMQF